jgi:hypothetical protein
MHAKEIPEMEIEVKLPKLICWPSTKHQKKSEPFTAKTKGIDDLAGPKLPKT